MRRCSSASCIRTKNPTSPEDASRRSPPSPGGGGGGGGRRRRPTVLTVDRLRRPAVDRMYLLSQLLAHANSVRFLRDYYDDDDDDDSGENRAPPPPSLPSSVMLYLPWRSNDYDDDDDRRHDDRHDDETSRSYAVAAARSFADGVVTDCVRRCLLANGDDFDRMSDDDDDEDDNDNDYGRARGGLSLTRSLDAIGDDGRRRDGPTKYDGRGWRRSGRAEGGRGRQQLTRIYVVVERVASASESDDDDDDEAGDEEEEEAGDEHSTVPLDDASPDLLDNEGESDDRKDRTSMEERRRNILPDRIRDRRGGGGGGSSGGGGRRRRPTRGRRRRRSTTIAERHERDAALAEQLARAVSSSSRLRGAIDGITVGVSSDPTRASPGLEACVEAVERGAKERRLLAASTSYSSSSSSSPPPSREDARIPMEGGESSGGRRNDEDEDDLIVAGYSRRMERALEGLRDVSPERSPLAIVAMRPEDLECHAEHHHHRHHRRSRRRRHGDSSSDLMDASDIGTRMLKCRISTEWNGKGEFNSFADRAMRDWRWAWRNIGGGGEGAGVRASCVAIDGCGNVNGKSRPKVSSITRGSRREVDDGDDMEKNVSEPISSVMVIIFLAVVLAHVWSTCGDAFIAYWVN